MRPALAQLPAGRLARWVVLLVAKRIGERWTVLSFAQRGEDLVLEGLLRRLPEIPHTYVDVGANHPVRDSNTYRLYLRGWRGVLVDANPQFAVLYARMRPRDKSFCTAISASAEPRAFRIPDESRLAHFVQESGWGPDDRVVTPQRLTAVLDEAGFADSFGVLSVDCEGADEDVLRSLDLDRHRPCLVVVEQPIAVLGDVLSNSLTRFLDTHGYDLVAHDGMNGYFLGREYRGPRPVSAVPARLTVSEQS